MKNLHVIEELRSGKTATEGLDSLHLERTITSGTGSSAVRDSFLKRMKPWSTTYSNESLLQLIFRPFYILLNPVILWAVLLISFFQLWTVVINFMLAQLFGPPPYLLDTAQLGYLAEKKLITPLTTHGNITDLKARRIVYDARTGEGGSGAPLFGPSGRVIGITFAIFTENTASNFAVPIRYAITLLGKAGWTGPANLEAEQKEAVANQPNPR